MSLVAVLLLVFGLAGWSAGVGKANSDWYTHGAYHAKCRRHCDYRNGMELVPWPIRKHAGYECPRADDVDKCTGEAFNGEWWYSPESSVPVESAP